MNGSEAEVVVVAGGLSIPLRAFRVAWALEARGFSFREDRGDLVVRPRHCLTDADRTSIRQCRDELLLLARHSSGDVQ